MARAEANSSARAAGCVFRWATERSRVPAMQWTMPPRVLKTVAAGLAVIATASFVLGIVNAPKRGRLPGEKAGGVIAAPMDATEATPLSQERIEGPPPPPELTPEEKAKLEADKLAKAELEAAKLAAATPEDAAKLTPAPVTPAKPPVDRVGDLLDSVTPPPEEPPH